MKAVGESTRSTTAWVNTDPPQAHRRGLQHTLGTKRSSYKIPQAFQRGKTCLVQKIKYQMLLGFSRVLETKEQVKPSRMPKENCFQLITKSSDKPSIRRAGRKDPMHSFHVVAVSLGLWTLSLHNAWHLPCSGGNSWWTWFFVQVWSSTLE